MTMADPIDRASAPGEPSRASKGLAVVGLTLAVAVGAGAEVAAQEGLVERLGTAIGAGLAPSETLPEGVRFLVRFAEEVDGLAVGATVTVKGIQIGTVREVAVVIDSAAATIEVPIVIDVVPERIDSIDGAAVTDAEAVYALAERLVANGLRAELTTTNPLSGSQRIELGFHPDAPPAALDRSGRYPELPTAPTLAQELRATLQGFLARLAALPIETLFADAAATVDEARALLAAPEIREALLALRAAGAEIERTAAGLDARLEPSIARLERAAGEVEGAARQAASGIAGLDRTIGARSPLWDEVRLTTRELAATARALRLLVEHLERHPDALLRGRQERQP
jgi:paraquat-inducible protein B